MLERLNSYTSLIEKQNEMLESLAVMDRFSTAELHLSKKDDLEDRIDSALNFIEHIELHEINKFIMHDEKGHLEMFSLEIKQWKKEMAHSERTIDALNEKASRFDRLISPIYARKEEHHRRAKIFSMADYQISEAEEILKQVDTAHDWIASSIRVKAWNILEETRDFVSKHRDLSMRKKDEIMSILHHLTYLLHSTASQSDDLKQLSRGQASGIPLREVLEVVSCS